MKTKCFIFGAGKNGKELLSYLNMLNEFEVVYFIDNDIKKQGKKIDNVKCISVDMAIRTGGRDEIVFVSPKAGGEEIKNQLQRLEFTKVICVGSWIGRAKYYLPKAYEGTDYSCLYPFNHYESPYPDIMQIHKRRNEVFNRDKKVLDIDFNMNRQLELLGKMEEIDLPGWTEDVSENGYRYYYKNDWFGKGSADALYYMIRILKPKKIIEIGSGYSTSVMLDTNERYFGSKINIISIEPRPDRLKSLLRTTDNLKIYEKDMQEIPENYFQQLEENDILFVDSSHVSRIDSDVNRLLFEILPRLNQGVYIHFHDMFYPFIYPEDWIYAGRAYTEMYLLRAFLMNNSAYSVQFFGSMLEQKYREKISDKLRDCGLGSIWIRKEV